MIVIAGMVTDTEPTSWTNKEGELVEQFKVWVSTGRDSLETTGPMEDSDYERGQKVLLRIEPRSWKDSTKVTARRISRVTLPELSELVGGSLNGKDK